MSSIRIAEGIHIASVILNAVLAVITFGYLRVTKSLAATAQEQSMTMQEQARSAAQQAWVSRDQWLSQQEASGAVAQYALDALAARLRNQSLDGLGSSFHLDGKPGIEEMFDLLIQSVRLHRGALIAYFGPEAVDVQYLFDREERWSDLKDSRIFTGSEIKELN